MSETMETTTVELVIPVGRQLPEQVSTFTPEEQLTMVEVGCAAIIESRKKALDRMIACERERLEREFDSYKEEIAAEADKRLYCQSAIMENTQMVVSRCVEIFSKTLGETGNRLNETAQMLTTIVDNSARFESSPQKGVTGEAIFKSMANETFRDFPGYDLLDKHSQKASGDFHLCTDEFDVLVDVKNFANGVSVTDRNKIKRDLLKHGNIHFAWLVSLNTSVRTKGNCLISYEWISPNQCVLYINSLLKYEDPKELLRVAWFSCRALMKLLSEDKYIDEDGELSHLRSAHYKHMERMTNLRKRARELTTVINSLKVTVDGINNEIMESLETLTDGAVKTDETIFRDWWENNVEETALTSKIGSSDVYFRFKRTHVQSKENTWTPDKFRKYLLLYVPESRMKQVTKSVYELSGYKLKRKQNRAIGVELAETLKSKIEMMDMKRAKASDEPNMEMSLCEEEVNSDDENVDVDGDDSSLA